MAKPSISLHDVSFHLPNSQVTFKHINIALEQQKIGIVGENGVGKTTLIKLLNGQLNPDAGLIQRKGTALTLPQSHNEFPENVLISDVLNVTSILFALDKMTAGTADAQDYELLNGNWDISKRLESALSYYQLWPIDLGMPFMSLSGGQRTKVLLAKALFIAADFLLFDEPTNNLDAHSRALFTEFVRNSHQGVIIVSHDRALLNEMDKVIEITSKNITLFGGNYNFYVQESAKHSAALEQDFKHKTTMLQRTKHSIQQRLERHDRDKASGKKEKNSQIKAKGSYDKLGLKNKKARSEKTNKQMHVQASRMVNDSVQQLKDTKDKLEPTFEMNVSLPKTRVANGKMVLAIKNLCFNFVAANQLIQNFNLTIHGPERVHLTGMNGSGKSTLLRLITHDLQPLSGSIDVDVKKTVYVDQQVSILNRNETLIENFLRFNPDQNPHDAYQALAQFNFRNIKAEKTASQLSGGECVRAGLAISLMSSSPPQFIVLDEPTNHLDIKSIAAIEQALKCYQGALLVVSHDQQFIDNINITVTIEM